MSDTSSYDVVILGAGIAGLYGAMRLLARGRRVALVDKGPAGQRAEASARPPLSFAERRNEGALEARHHVVGGNSAYWGGALVRQREGEMAAMLGLAGPGAEEEIARHYGDVEELLGLPADTNRWGLDAGGQALRMCRVVVLPGRKRNLGRSFLATARRQRSVGLYTSSQILGLDMCTGGRLRAVYITDAEGRPIVLEAQHFILSLGVVDSNLFGLAYARDLGVGGGAPLGHCLHDHLSVPLFDITPTADGRFQRELLPAFSGPFIIGRRVELQGDGRGWAPSGFLHFQCIFDEAEPYSSIKRLMELRQKGVLIGEGLRALAGCAGALPAMAKIAAHRVFGGRLYISPAVRIVATLDFESFPSPENSLIFAPEDGGGESAVLRWDARREDEGAFLRLLSEAQIAVAALSRRYGFAYTPVRGLETMSAPERYLRQYVRDAYHLGGGLQAGKSPEDSVCDEKLRWRGVPNLHVLSTAVFRRPGSANPVLTLLALADWVAAGL